MLDNVQRRENRAACAHAFLNAGFAMPATAGMLANIEAESGYDPAAKRLGDQPHYSGEARHAHGLFQLGGKEWMNYEAWLKAHVYALDDWAKLEYQCEYMIDNLRKNYPVLWRQLLRVTRPEEAANLFEAGFERPAIQNRGKRGLIARRIYEEMNT